MKQLAITTERNGDAIVLGVEGELDIATAGQLEQALQACCDPAAAVVVADLRAVSFIDSTGLRTLLEGKTALAAGDGRLAVVAGSGAVERLLRLTNLDQQFELFETPAAAVERSESGNAPEAP